MVKTVKKGSITIFLALILSLILSLVSASIESVRMSAARTQILNSMDTVCILCSDSMTGHFWRIMTCLHYMQAGKRNRIWHPYMRIFSPI